MREREREKKKEVEEKVWGGEKITRERPVSPPDISCFG